MYRSACVRFACHFVFVVNKDFDATAIILAQGVQTMSASRPGLVVVAETDADELQKPLHRIVFEVNVDGADQWRGILNNIENVQTAFGQDTTAIEVVSHGKGLGLILKTNEAMHERLQSISDTGVNFAACENTMRGMNVGPDDLMPFTTTVDSGVAEVVRRQEAGCAYIKAGA